MTQLNFYKKRCYLTDSEQDAVNVFFKNLFNVKDVADIHIYLIEGNVIADIEGYETPKATSVGSVVQHDRPTTRVFKEFEQGE